MASAVAPCPATKSADRSTQIGIHWFAFRYAVSLPFVLFCSMVAYEISAKHGGNYPEHDSL